MSTTSTLHPTFARGVHPPERKDFAAEVPIEVLPSPKQVRIPLLQHLGAPCKPILKPRSKVAVGDMVGEPGGFVSAPVHTSVAGTVGREAKATLANGRRVPALPIDADEEQPLIGEALRDDVLGGSWPIAEVEQIEPQKITDAAKEAGLVGLGGAAFPTHVKLTRNDKKPIRYLLINGCECEPYLTADYRLMLEAPAAVVAGALLAQRATGAAEAILCVEDNKPKAIEALRAAAQETSLEVRVLQTKYPQGGEKQLVSAVLRKEVPTGGLPLDVGAVVMNVGTASALARAVIRRKPLTHRIVTVSGAGIVQPKNLLVPIGTSYRELIDYCGGFRDNAARVVSGGPMMGFTLGSLDLPVTKGTSGITVLTHDEARKADETACVRCGQCVEVCPMRLMPTKLALAARARDADLIRRHHVAACMECGCCAYVCPASIPLVQLIRLAKVIAM
jgi:electron transport complex protein RnfC